MGEAQQSLVFENEEAREAALNQIPDEPPQGANVENWTAEQEAREREILEAPIKGSDEAAPETQPPVETEEPPAKEEPTQVAVEEDEVDFAALGKVKKSDLPEDLQGYKSPQEMIKQAAHARRYANKSEEKLREAEARIAELENTAKTVPDLQKKLEELEKATKSVTKDIEAKPSISSGQRAQLHERLKAINEKVANLKEDDFSDGSFQGLFKETVSTLGDTLGELDAVKRKLAEHEASVDKRYSQLESGVKTVTQKNEEAERQRKTEREQKEAEKGLAELQSKFKDLQTSKPLYADNRNDVESAVVKFASRVYGRRLNSFDDVNRLVGLYNAEDAEVKKICQEEGISPADFGLTDKDVRNYGILMNVYWQQRGQQINPSTGKLEPVLDFRGQKVTHPDFETTLKYMKDRGGISQLEIEDAIVNAEKKGQSKLESSLNRRDTSPPVLGPTGTPSDGQGMSKDQAYEILGEKEGRLTVDEEKMELLLRKGSQKGWDMWNALVKAHEVLEIEPPRPETYWKKPKAQ